MTVVIQARSLLEHIRLICERPRMYAPDFTLGHLLLFIHGYEVALADRELPGQHERFREWLYGKRPGWRNSSMWWGGHVLMECAGNLEQALDEIIRLVDEFSASDGP